MKTYNYINKILKKREFTFFLFFLVVVLTIFPRVIEVLNQNPIFGFDQGREMFAARNIVVNHKLILIGTELGAGSAGIGGIFHGPMYYYFLTIPFVLLKGDPNGGTLFMFIFGVATVYLSYFFGRKIMGWPAGLIFAFLVALSPILVAQSRFLWSPNLSSFFILLSLLFTYRFVDSYKKIFLSSFFAAFVYNFEMATAIPLSLSLFIYSLFIFRKQIKKYLVLLLGFVMAFLPMILFELRHDFMAIRGLYSYIFLHKGTEVTALFFQRMVVDHAWSFFYNFKDTFILGNIFLTSLLIVVIAISTGIYLFKEKDKEIRNFIRFLLILILVTFGVFLFLRNTVYTFYLVDLSFAYMFLFTYVLVRSFEKKDFKIFIIPLLLLLIILILGIKNSIIVSKQDYSDHGGTAKLKGKIEAIDYIYKDAKGKPFNLLVFSPPVYTYPYDYLILWYGKEKYGFLPGSEKKDTFYLLIETDNSKPWSYKGWLETVVKTGEVLETRKLPNGFIVQKRQE